MKINEIDCWDGYKKQGTKPGTGKNKGKRVNNCVKEKYDDVGQKIYKGNTTRVVNTPVADKNISVADQRMQKAGNRINRDIANMKAGGDTVITPGNTL